MRTFDKYGIAQPSLEDARELVEDALGISLRLHESSYRCGDYYRCDEIDVGGFILQRNYDDVEDEWAEPDHRDYTFVLELAHTVKRDLRRERLESEPGVILIRRVEL